MLTTKMLGILFWEVCQNHLIPTIITQTTIAITTIIEVITIIVATVIITTILAVATTLLPTDYNANLLYESLSKKYF